MAFLKNDKIGKALARRLESSVSEMADSRIITKNLVYVIGLSSRIASRETLLKREYFGQYGNITKIVVNSNKAYNQNNPKGPSFSAYVTYSKPYEASLAILSLDNILVDDHLIRASFGTTKYCSFYLKKVDCTNKDCLFLHKHAEPSDIISRDDLNGNRNIFFEQQLYAIKIADLYNPETKKRIFQTVQSHYNISNKKLYKSVFPSIENIYNKKIVIDNDPVFTNNIKKKYYEDTNYTNYQNKYQDKEQKENILKNTNNTSYKETPSKQKINCLSQTLDSLKIKKNTDTTSTSSKEDLQHISCIEERLKEINPKPLIKLYEAKSKSRFNFNGVEGDKINIPDFIQKIITKKLSSHILSRNIKHIEDVLYSDKYLEQELTKKNDWAQFLIENKSTQLYEYYDTELVQDFIQINRRVVEIINKFDAYK